MNPAHLHIILNHIPVLWTVLGVIILLVAVARGSGDAKNAALALLILSALVAVPTSRSGESAAEIIGAFVDVPDGLIHAHETWAFWSLGAKLVLGFFALVCLILYHRSRDIPRGWTTFILVLSLLGSSLLGWTALLGGRIHHEEARPGFVPGAHPIEREGGR